MDLQDKEFDSLLRSKLDDFEVKPSAGVWDSIDAELNAGRRKKILLPLLSIAASIVVLLVAGLLFIPQRAKINRKHPVQNNIAQTKSQAKNRSMAKNNTQPAILKVKDAGKQHLAFTAVNRIARVHTVKKAKEIIAQPNQFKSLQEQPVLAAVTNHEQITAVVPDKATELNIKQPVDETEAFITKPALTATPIPVNNKTDAIAVKPKHRAHTLGDLINLAVAKVDKRHDKFIEFTNTDDNDEANITGVNIGILKIKKEK